MGIRVKNVDRLTNVLEQVGDKAVKGVADAMERGAVRVARLARRYAPVDEHNLEEAIKIDSDRGGENRRKRYFVYVDTTEPAPAFNESGMVVPSSLNKTVGDYALAMHEGLSPYGSGAFQPGPKTLAKGRYAGGKFMTRALRDAVEDITFDAQAAFSRAFKGIARTELSREGRIAVNDLKDLSGED